jgi:glycine/D-amino acid oxidase-like deaminating enzyme
VIAGAGIIGASIAYHLTQLGIKVTVLDAYGPASHATRGTFAWVNASWAKQPRHYHAFSQKGVSGWAAISKALNIPLSSKGSLEWFESHERQIKLAEQIAEQAEWGEAARMLSEQDFTAIEPQIDFQGAEHVALSANDVALNPVLATENMLAFVETNGGFVDYPNRALSFENGIVQTESGPIDADHLVIATGADMTAPQNLGGVTLPQRSTPGVIAVTEPMPELIDHIIVAPGVHIHQRADGRIVMGEQGGAPDTHGDRLRSRPNDFPEMSFAEMHGEMVLDLAINYLPELNNAVIEDVYIGWRPLPLDGHPVLGFVPNKRNVSIAITHSGVTLAPVIGQLMADMIVSGNAPEIFNNYRADRNFESSGQY